MISLKPKTERVIFENITQDEIASNTKNSSGSGGPTQIEMETWKEMICLKSYGTHSLKLADEIDQASRDRHHSTQSHINSPRLQTCSTKEKRQQH